MFHRHNSRKHTHEGDYEMNEWIIYSYMGTIFEGISTWCEMNVQDCKDGGIER